ncbi:hypothetical protein KM043_008152 [Ampulex compressa]|nr:hypothetical protein KM043_008152 [Ampulex compressa]
MGGGVAVGDVRSTMAKAFSGYRAKPLLTITAGRVGRRRCCQASIIATNGSTLLPITSGRAPPPGNLRGFVRSHDLTCDRLPVGRYPFDDDDSRNRDAPWRRGEEPLTFVETRIDPIMGAVARPSNLKRGDHRIEPC